MLTSVGDTFYGIFSASNADNGIDALFPDVSFQRDFIGAPGTASFQLTNLTGSPVNFSIDPFVFSVSLQSAVPEPATRELYDRLRLSPAGVLEKCDPAPYGCCQASR